MHDATDEVVGEGLSAPEDHALADQLPEDPDQLVEIEYDGRRWQAPAGLKDAVLRHADYTRKTQALAEERRALEAERAAAAEASPEDLAELARVAALDQALGRYAGVDWRGWQAADPAAAARAFADYTQLAGERETVARQAEQRRLVRTLEAERERANRLEAAAQELARDIEGWSPQLREQLAAFAEGKGFTRDELAEVEDPRAVKVLHLAMLGEQALATQQAGRTRAFDQPRPPTQVSGQGFAGHLPSDRQGADAWMAARRAQLRKKA